MLVLGNDNRRLSSVGEPNGCFLRSEITYSLTALTDFKEQ